MIKAATDIITNSCSKGCFWYWCWGCCCWGCCFCSCVDCCCWICIRQKRRNSCSSCRLLAKIITRLRAWVICYGRRAIYARIFADIRIIDWTIIDRTVKARKSRATRKYCCRNFGAIRCKTRKILIRLSNIPSTKRS